MIPHTPVLGFNAQSKIYSPQGLQAGWCKSKRRNLCLDPGQGEKPIKKGRNR